MAKLFIDQPIADSRSESDNLTLRDRLHIRTRELAAIAGRDPFKITQFDYEQAKRDLTGEVDMDRQNNVLDHESSRHWKKRTSNLDSLNGFSFDKGLTPL